MELEEVIEIEVEAQESAPQGLSAYEIYLNNGGTLSEEEWIASLKGEKGDKGEQGERGIQGEQGPQGEIGPIGPQGEKGEKGDQGEVGPQGPRGEQGPQGIQGIPGETGPTGSGVSLEEVKIITGELENLESEDKSNLVNAINEALSNAGGGSGITELTGNASVYNAPGVYINKSSSTIYVNVTSTSKGTSSNGIFMYPDELFLVCKTSMGTSLFKWAEGIIYIYCGKNTAESSFNPYWFVRTSENQTVNGVKTFGSLPVCSGTPTSNNQLVNKKYVDTAIANLKAELTS